MRATLGLFWRKVWDNLGHIVITNMIWLMLAVPFGVGIWATAAMLIPEAPPGAVVFEAEGAAEGAASSEPDLGPGGEPVAAPADAAQEAGPVAARPEDDEALQLEWSAAVIPAIIFLALAWVLLCIATGFVFHVTADFVRNYDFSGYREVLKRFLRRGPMVRSVVIVTLALVTLVATWANTFFYLHLAARYGLALFILAGVMLWFSFFVAMAFSLALPLSIQRDLTIWQSIKTGAVLSLSAPGRTLVVLGVAFVVFVIGMMSGAGAGFFAVSGPATLFNAAAKVHLDEAEGREPGKPEDVGTAETEPEDGDETTEA